MGVHGRQTPSSSNPDPQSRRHPDGLYCRIQVSAGFYPDSFAPPNQTDRLQHAIQWL